MRTPDGAPDDQWTRVWDARLAALTSVLGQPADTVFHAVIPFHADVERRPGEALVVAFEDGSKLSISLRREDYSGPEAYHAHGFERNAWKAE